MDEKIKNLINKYNNLIKSKFLTFQDVKRLKNIMGVYVIYNGKEKIYIGSTNKFDIRFSDLLYESTHTLGRKLIDNNVVTNRENLELYLKNQCKIQIERCDTTREAEALEHFAIYMLNPIYNKK